MFATLWIIAGFFTAYYTMQIVCVAARASLPIIHNIIVGLIGALTAYTVMYH